MTSPLLHPGSPAPFGPPAEGEDPLLSELAGAAHAAATRAAALLLDAFGRPAREVETKSSRVDMVSAVDRAAEAAVTATLTELRPDDGLLAEEGTSRPSRTGVRWVVDPLDGTTNFLFGVPLFSVSVAAEVGGKPAVGVIIDPCRGETWSAVAGRGAWLNGSPIRVAEGRSDISRALVATGFSYNLERRVWQSAMSSQVIPQVRDVRRFGSAALDLCWVAGGRFDCYYEWDLKPWDLCAGDLICREAGGRVEVLPDNLVVAGTRALFPELAARLARALASAGEDRRDVVQ